MKEKCIRCGVKTPYEKEKRVDLRYFYVEGAGQLCNNCYNLIYGNERENNEHI